MLFHFYMNTSVMLNDDETFSPIFWHLQKFLNIKVDLYFYIICFLCI